MHGEDAGVEPGLLKRALFPQAYEEGAYRLAAIIDAARWPGLLSRLSWHDGEWLPLYVGRATQPLYEAIPHVALLEPQSGLLDDIAAAFGQRNTLFVKIRKTDEHGSSVRLTDFVKHFWRVPHVTLAPNGERAWMRLYDPEIFQDFWNIASDMQKKRLLGTCLCGFVAENLEHGKNLADITPTRKLQSAPQVRPDVPLLLSLEQQEFLGERHAARFMAFLRREVMRSRTARGLRTPEAELARHVESSVALAEGYGFVDENDLHGFVLLDERRNWRLANDRECQRILARTNFESSTRLMALRNLLESGGCNAS